MSATARRQQAGKDEGSKMDEEKYQGIYEAGRAYFRDQGQFASGTTLSVPYPKGSLEFMFFKAEWDDEIDLSVCRLSTF